MSISVNGKIVCNSECPYFLSGMFTARCIAYHKEVIPSKDCLKYDLEPK